jgi:hypothetical protein
MDYLVRTWGSTAAMAMVVGAVALWSVHCDTVAEISFDIRKYDRVVSGGVTNASMCTDNDGRVQLRFVVLDQAGEVIRPGDSLETGEVSASSMNVSLEQGRLYPVTTKELVRCPSPCSADSDCTEQLGKLCQDGFCVENLEQDPNAACTPAGLDVCQPFDPAVDELGNASSLPGSYQVSFCRLNCTSDADCNGGTCTEGGFCALDVRGEFCTSNTQCPAGFNCEAIEGDGDGRSFCTLDTAVQTTGQLEFTGPTPTNGNEQPIAVALVLDNSGSLFGRGLVEDDKTVRTSRATDPTGFRQAAAKTFMINLSRKQFAENAVVSAWAFRGESDLGVRPLFGDIANVPPNPYTARFGSTQPQTSDLTAIDELARTGDFGRSPVYEALETVAQNMIDLPNLVSRRTPYIVLFTDGPDDTALITEGATVAERELALQQWQAKLDAAVDKVNEAGARVYIVHLDSGLSAEGLSALSPDARNAAVFGRDSNGRVGPVAEYAEIACRTGGHYMYLTDPAALTDGFDNLVDLIGGTWEVEVGVESLEQPALFTGAYRLGMDIEVQLDGRNDTYSHNPYGGGVFGGQLDANDTRSVVFKRQGNEPPRLIGQGGAASGGAGEE